MQRFDCLALNCPLLGPHLLEASAGTGKTFSIEHIFVRLVMESIPVEEILAVTFTRAATRELKGRIRNNLEKALHYLEREEAPWEYLQPHLGSVEMIGRLSDGLASFDRAQIFTIHGFCYRMLSQFSFEAKLSFVPNPDEAPQVPEKLKQGALDFLQNGISESLLCKEQLDLLTKEFESVGAIVEKLVRMKKGEGALSFSASFLKCKAALQPWNLSEELLFQDYFALSEGALSKVKGDFERQIKGLVDPKYFPWLFKEKGSLFDFLSRDNRKIKAKYPEKLNYPGFFDWSATALAPLFKQKVFPILQGAWNPIGEKILADEEYLGPDEILEQMKEAVRIESFRGLVEQKYQSAIIDEFQDTDPIQWEIFEHLFVNKGLKALYLVGDPKQSIYRFRNADVYTYLKARSLLGEEHLYHLDTNFRSSKKLIGALNALFDRDWLYLPKQASSLPYHPVQAGADLDAEFGDEKGAVHFVVAEGEASRLFDEAFLPYAAMEIERLKTSKCAILVKDRYQAERAFEFLRKRNIAAVAKSHTPLGKTGAYQAIRELFDAILSPRDPNAQKVVLCGPFGKEELPLSEYKILLEEKGLVPLASRLSLDGDAIQIFEWLFEWEREEGFSFEGLKRAMNRLYTLDEVKRRVEVDEEAVQIMTLHISKGLEFEIVFAWGLASRTPGGDEELDAEKLRQLYVAMTRAKKRLYVPVSLSNRAPDEGTQSPFELFSRCFKGPFLDEIESLSKRESITIEQLSLPLLLEAPFEKEIDRSSYLPKNPLPFTPSYLSSFTALAKGHEAPLVRAERSEGFTLQTMPRGAETGILIHKIFEHLFSASQPIWREDEKVDLLVEEQLHHSPLAPWKESIQEMVKRTVSMPLQADGEFFSLSEIEKFQVEMEFVFSTPPNFIKGFIDLLFFYQNKVYFLDWKSNYLEDYGTASLEKAMKEHDYPLQAALYSEAVRRYFKVEFGGAFYLFVRGGAVYYLRKV